MTIDTSPAPGREPDPAAVDHLAEPSLAELADLVVDGTSSVPDIPETDFRLSRFAEGDLLRSPHPYVGAGQMR